MATVHPLYIVGKCICARPCSWQQMLACYLHVVLYAIRTCTTAIETSFRIYKETGQSGGEFTYLIHLTLLIPRNMKGHLHIRRLFWYQILEC